MVNIKHYKQIGNILYYTLVATVVLFVLTALVTRSIGYLRGLHTDVTNRAIVHLLANTGQLPNIEREYIKKQLTDCLNDQDRFEVVVGYNRFLPFENLFPWPEKLRGEYADQLTSICLEEYVLSATSIDGLYKRHNQLSKIGLATLDSKRIKEIASLLEGSICPEGKLFNPELSRCEKI